MILKKIIVKTTTKGTDIVSAILLNNGCNGTTIVDKADVIVATKDEKQANELTKYYPESALVVGVIENENPSSSITKIRNLLKELREYKELGPLTARIEEVNSEHWSDIWQDYYKAYVVGKIKICGTWQKSNHSLFKIPIYLNPGAAFGTGQHPTTELVITAMQKFNLKDKYVLDVGCGSGILGICAVKLGAKHATLIDIDDVAIESSLLNAETNKIENKVTVVKEDIIYTPNTNFKGDVIFVNISSQVNLDYSKNINNNINPNGILILSGILPEYRNKTKDAYINVGFELVEEYTLENWITFVLRKK